MSVLMKPLMPTGKYVVGLWQQDLIDNSRLGEGGNSGRLIPIQIYFPTNLVDLHLVSPKALELRGLKDYPQLEGFCWSRKAELGQMLPGKNPLVLFNHGNKISMTDYSMLLEDLASHGFVVVSIQHQLLTDSKPAKIGAGRTINKHAQIIDNLMYVFSWLEANCNVFSAVDLSRVCLMGHSMGANALMFLAHRVLGFFRPEADTLLPHSLGHSKVSECIVFLDGEIAPPMIKKWPIFFGLSHERANYRQDKEVELHLKALNYDVFCYPHSRHISFMDHAWVLQNSRLHDFFNGNTCQLEAFYQTLRANLLKFIQLSLNLMC